MTDGILKCACCGMAKLGQAMNFIALPHSPENSIPIRLGPLCNLCKNNEAPAYAYAVAAPPSWRSEMPPRLAAVLDIRPPDQRLITLLERTLARARGGEIDRLVVLTYNDADGARMVKVNGNHHAVLGALHIVCHDIEASMAGSTMTPGDESG